MLLETILGVVTGLVGPIVTSITNYKMQKLRNEDADKERTFQLAKINAETEAMIKEAEANIKIAETKVAGEIELADAGAYQTSQEVGNQPSLSMSFMTKMMEAEGWVRYITFPIGALVAALFGIVDFLKNLMRPALTSYLVGVSTWITILAWDIMQKHEQAITPEQAIEIFQQNTNIIVYLTVSCVTWWFADRRIAKFLMRLGDGNLKTSGNPTGR